MNADEFITITDAANLIKRRELSPIELIENILKRIKCYDKKLHSFITILEKEALVAAEVAEKEINSGNYKGSLHGIPIALKDVFEMEGVPTTCQSKIMQNHISTQDSQVVKRLKQAGAILLGKLTLHEFSLGGPSTDLPWPLARNPWDISRFAGGSSSGSGIAVAAGFALGSTATDAGGSLRGPAALNGATGIKPTFGLVSRTGIIPLSYSLDHAGPIAWTTQDCALMLQAMAGFDQNDPVSANHTIPDYTSTLTSNVKGLKIGLLRHFYASDLKAKQSTIDAIDRAAKQLEDMGCVVSEIQLSPLSDYANCGTVIMLSEGYAIHENNLRSRFTDYGEVFRDRLLVGALFTSADYFEAMRRKKELINEINTVFDKVDVILTATVSNEAPKIEAVSKFSIIERPLYTMPFNVTGNPAMTLCCGYTEEGLPLAMQLVGKHFDEATLFQVAYAYEQSTTWRNRRPILTEM